MVSGIGTWQSEPMTRPRSSTPLAGGSLFALSTIAGAVIGAWRGQPSIGFLGGLAVGVVLITVVWLIDRRR